VIGTLDVDEWAVTFGTAIEEGRGWAAASPNPLLAVPNVTAHSSTSSVPITVPINGQCTNYILSDMWHYNYQCPLKGKVIPL